MRSQRILKTSALSIDARKLLGDLLGRSVDDSEEIGIWISTAGIMSVEAGEKWEMELDHWMDGAPDIPSLTDEAIRRETIYTREDHW